MLHNLHLKTTSACVRLCMCAQLSRTVPEMHLSHHHVSVDKVMVASLKKAPF